MGWIDPVTAPPIVLAYHYQPSEVLSCQFNGQFTATQFYADVDGHPKDRSLALALDELKLFCAEFRVLGVYPESPLRKGLG